jgi:predicted transposase/invertase (TIGR01784 family)
MAKEKTYIQYDWAIKRLFRKNSNFVMVEGLLSLLQKDPIKIHRKLESESNKKNPEDKFNRMNLLAGNKRGELIIEVQTDNQYDYFHRMLYGVSSAMTEYIYEGDSYDKIKKVYSINILYFELGQGEDYIYHGRTEFRGIHKSDVMRFTKIQEKQYRHEEPDKLYTEYNILRVDGFDKKAVTPSDERISFLKTSEIHETARVPGLQEARERLHAEMMSKEEPGAHNAYLDSLRQPKSVLDTNRIESEAKDLPEGLQKELPDGKLLHLFPKKRKRRAKPSKLKLRNSKNRRQKIPTKLEF